MARGQIWQNFLKLLRFMALFPSLVFSDANHRGCLRTRKSTSCFAMCHGQHMIKFTNATQQPIALSSAESEYYALTRAAAAVAAGAGCINMAKDLGMTLELRFHGDATAASGIAHRCGAGRLRHIECSTHWLQRLVTLGIISLWYHFANAPACCRSLSGPSRPKCPRSVPRVSPKTWGVRGSVRRGVSGPFGPMGSGVSKKCPESVPGVSKRCPGHCGDSLGTLFVHSGARGPKGPGDTPPDTLSDTPSFRGHSRGHSGDTSGPKGPKGPRDSSRPGRSQVSPRKREPC